MNSMYMKKRLFFVAKAFFAAFLSLIAVNFVDARIMRVAPADFTYKQPLVINTDKTPSWSFNCVAFVHDNNKQTFIIKSYHNSEHAIHEALGAYIGASVGIRINKVKIIPPHITCVGKNNDCAATIHTCVPGVEVQHIDTMVNKPDVYGGLNCSNHLHSLVEHDDLCSIVALDIFLDNFDRHNGNLFLDQSTGLFYAIDMDRVFYPALAFPMTDLYDKEWDKYGFADSIAARTYDFLITLQSYALSPQEKIALTHVRDYLNKLIIHYPCSKLYDVWMRFAQEAVYTYSAPKKEYIHNLIDHNFCQVQQVVAQIDRLAVA